MKKTAMTKKTLQMLTAVFGLLILCPTILLGQISNPRADASVLAFNETYLATDTNGNAYYKVADNTNTPDAGWTLALDIQAMLDVYERTGSATDRAITDDLMSGFLALTPPPYTWDGWNDDLAWMALVMARGNEMIGNEALLAAAESTFHLAYDRGWNTDFNDGGIWEQQPNYTSDDSGKIKEALSNNPIGHIACILYKSTGDEYYLEKAKEIYSWSVSHIFNPINGQVYGGVYRNGFLNKGQAVYNQGTFIDFSNALYQLTRDEIVLRNAIMAADYTINHMTTAEGIISNDAGYLDTWGAEFARGLGHLVKSNPEFWNKYYPFLKKNSESAWENRRMDLNLTWNGWDKPTPEDIGVKVTKYVSAFALHQHTPVLQYIMDDIEAEDYNFWKGITTESMDAGGKSVKLTNTGDWVEYLVEISASGVYTISMDVAASTAGSFEIAKNHIKVATVDVPATGGFETFATVRAAIQLNAGIQTIRFKNIAGEWRMDQWRTEKCDLIQPQSTVNGGAVLTSASLILSIGNDLQFDPLPNNGTWSWVGPNNFTSDSRVVSISGITATQAGVYTAQYVNAAGCISIQDFLVSIDGCTPSQTSATISVYNGDWQETTDVITAGSFVKISGMPTDAGTWSWSGPNGVTADTRELTINSIGYKEVGEYTACFTNASGCQSTANVSLSVTGEDPCSSPIIPYISIVGWKELSIASVSAGATIQFGPQASEGTWSWTGPGEFTSDQREFTVSDFNQSKAGNYIATFTNEMGCVSTKKFIIGLAGCSSESITPSIQVDGQTWTHGDSISVSSGGSFTITPPDITGEWLWSGDNGGAEHWEGPYGFTSSERILAFDQVLDIRQGTYALLHVDEQACISFLAIDVYVVGDDYCSTPIVPFINANNGGWEELSNATLEIGEKFTVGPHPVIDRNIWLWTGPNGFTSNDREFTINNIQVVQGGTYIAMCTNNIGCRSYMDFEITVNGGDIVDPDVLALDEVIAQSLYPNPATERVNLSGISTAAIITMYDINGRVETNVSFSRIGGEIEMNVGGLERGVYFIRVVDKHTKTLKFIKQ